MNKCVTFSPYTCKLQQTTYQGQYIYIKLVQNYYCIVETNNVQYQETFDGYATQEAII